MIGKMISQYRIMEKLGEGGIGVIYKAEDIKLNRIVALKFLKTDPFLSDEKKNLFFREARAAASLDHENICTIYDIIEEDAHICIIMAYVSGMTLKDKIQAGPLEVRDAVHITEQIARGLEAAHKNGIIHRDITCSNIMVSDDARVKIMDFGLAFSQDMFEHDDDVSVGGTAAYMSPEQCRGEQADHRSDIWSLGICLYEILTGRLPYEETYAQAVMYSIQNEDPTPLLKYAPRTCSELVYIVDKAMHKEANNRYQTVREILSDLEKLGKTVKSGSIEETMRINSVHPSIAVLPFADMSPDKDQEYFCDGIAEEIINALNQVEDLRVVARTSSFTFKNTSCTIQEIGEKLGVNSLLEGSVRKSGNKLRITVQLTNVSLGNPIWSERYDRELQDIFAIQEQIAGNIVQVLKVELSEKEKSALSKTTTRDHQAFDFYLRGRQFYLQTTRRGITYALEMYEHAIERDPRYALAYAGTSECYSYLYSFFDNDPAHLENALLCGRKALELDPDLSESHVACGRAFYHNGQYSEAEEEFLHAIRLNSSSYSAFEGYARNCYNVGNLEKSAEMFERAMRIDPANFNAPLLLQQVYRNLQRFEESRKILDIGLSNGKKHLEFYPDDARALYMVAIAMAIAGMRDEAHRFIAQALSIDPEDQMISYGAACVYAQTGREEEAIDMLEKALSVGCFHKAWVEKDPDLDNLRDYPRFKALLARLN